MEKLFIIRKINNIVGIIEFLSYLYDDSKIELTRKKEYYERYKEYRRSIESSYCGGKNNEYEAIKVIDAWNLGFSLGNTVKYISRAGKKETDKEIQDLKKALWYLEHHIKTLESK